MAQVPRSLHEAEKPDAEAARLRIGDRIRVNVRLLSGWTGFGNVISDQQPGSDLVFFRRHGDNRRAGFESRCIALRSEISLVRRARQRGQPAAVRDAIRGW